jgi:hypothetical protein
MSRADRLALYRVLPVGVLARALMPAEVALVTVAIHYEGTREGAAELLDAAAARMRTVIVPAPLDVTGTGGGA